jgi:hypothetical protein
MTTPIVPAPLYTHRLRLEIEKLLWRGDQLIRAGLCRERELYVLPGPNSTPRAALDRRIGLAKPHRTVPLSVAIIRVQAHGGKSIMPREVKNYFSANFGLEYI